MSILSGEVTTLAFCWRVERRDGVCLGFTTHDRDFEIDGLVYRAAPGLLPSAISVSDGFDADALEVAGALTSDAFSDADLRTGRWDRAGVSVFLADWQQPDSETVELARGELGEVAVKANGFETALRGPAALLERPVVEQTSPECRAELGDKRCRVDMAKRTIVTRVAAIESEIEIEIEEAAPDDDRLAYGRLRWLTGANSGLTSFIAGSDGTRLSLRDPPDSPAEAGDLIEIREGCDKRFATCAARFGNAENFRGEPHLPGFDLLTRYPGV